jgi:hypothetical protein
MTLDNNDEIAALRNQVFILLVALIVVSGTLTVFLYRQVSITNKDITQDQRLALNLNTNEMVLREVVGRLVSYGEKHPDYLPILKKNGLAPAGPAPAAPAAPKK